MARRYWDEESASELAFCRVTALALLRHLTNVRILGDAALDGAAAWRALETWLAVPQVTLLPEPPGLEELLAQWAKDLGPRAGQWTDAYIAAFAVASGCRLVAFDTDFRRFRGIDFLHLLPSVKDMPAVAKSRRRCERSVRYALSRRTPAQKPRTVVCRSALLAVPTCSRHGFCGKRSR